MSISMEKITDDKPECDHAWQRRYSEKTNHEYQVCIHCGISFDFWLWKRDGSKPSNKWDYVI